MEIYFLDRLINFTSNSFDEYIKKLEELKKKFRDDTNDEDDKNLDDLELKADDIDGKNDDNSKGNADKKDYGTNNSKNAKNKKNKQSKIQQQKLKKKKIMSQYFFKLNLVFGIVIGIILFLSLLYYILSLVINIKMKNNYNEFDSILTQINSVYLDSFQIFLTFKEQIELYYNTENRNILKILSDSEIERPKIGNSLMQITHSSKYSPKV